MINIAKLPSEMLYQFSLLPTVLKRVSLSSVCHVSLDSGFNTVYFRALMKSTSVVNGSISIHWLPFRKRFSSPINTSFSYQWPRSPYSRGIHWGVCLTLNLWSIQKCKKFCCFFWSQAEFSIFYERGYYLQSGNSGVKKYNSPIVEFLDAFLRSEPYLWVTYHRSDSSLVI